MVVYLPFYLFNSIEYIVQFLILISIMSRMAIIFLMGENSPPFPGKNGSTEKLFKISRVFLLKNNVSFPPPPKHWLYHWFTIIMSQITTFLLLLCIFIT